MIGRLLCALGVHHVPDERRRRHVSGIGWYGQCTRPGCGNVYVTPPRGQR